VPVDLADNAAALTEGYTRTQVDRGATANPRYISRYEKAQQCDGSSGCLRQIEGDDNVSQVNADTEALAALNAVRRYVYGSDTTNINKGPKTGTTLVVGRH
jgi:hypothetical protein